jgi:hypothetical protein
MLIKMSVWNFILIFVFSTLTVFGANASEDLFNISEFYEETDYSQRRLLKIAGNTEAVPAVILTIENANSRIMQIFDDDVCVTGVIHPIANFTASFACRSGAEMKISFNCTRSSCYLQGHHSGKGKWKDLLKPNFNQRLSLEEVLLFAGNQINGDKENSSIKDIQNTQSNTANLSKLDKAKSTCTELGFTLGTEKHGECVLKMMNN